MQIYYWEYFLSIEDDLYKTSRFVEFVPENYNTFSIEFSRIILSSCSEIDVIAKEICSIISEEKKASNVSDYREIILSRFPKFHSVQLNIPRFKIILNPWSDWEKSENPSWWKSYNRIKHQRSSHYNEATLSTALNSVAGLLSCLLYYFWLKEGDRVTIEPSPQLFQSKYLIQYEYSSIKLDFNLPDDRP